MMTRANQVLAKNHLGWEVQAKNPKFPNTAWYPAIDELTEYTYDGVPIYKPLKPFKDYEEAIKIMEEMKTSPIYRKDLEYRIYEVVSEKKK